MKKIICSIFCLICAFSLVACGNENALDFIASSQPPISNAATSPDFSESTVPQPGENDKQKSNILIAYFSLVDIVPEGADAVAHATPYAGNTQTAAYAIQNLVGGDVFMIRTENEYPVSHQEGSVIAEQELSEDARPVLTTYVENMEQYDIIYLGYPIWWYTAPMVIRSFLEEYDFSDKTIVPFCKSMGAGIEESIRDIKRLCPDTTVMDGLRLSTGRGDFSEEINEWLIGLGLLSE